MKLYKRDEPLSIFVHSTFKIIVEDFIFHSYIFKEKLGFDLDVVPFNTDSKVMLSENLKFIAKNNSHLEKYKIYDVDNCLSFVSLSFLFDDKQNSVIYTGDIGNENDLFLFNNNVDWFITETTHINLENLSGNFEKTNSTKLILTHIDDELEEQMHNFLKSLPANLQNHIIIAYDGFDLAQSN
jgi:ribonuclease BN (tRNA processing enzyme)